MTRWLTTLWLTALLLAGCSRSDTKREPEKKGANPKVSEAKPPAEPARPPARRPDKPDVPAIEDLRAAPADAQEGKEGVVWKLLEPPTGEGPPRGFDQLEVEYVVWASADGRMLDRSRGRPAKMFAYQAPRDWSVLLSEMKAGEKRRAWIPEELARAERPGAPKGGLTLDIKLLSIKPMPPPPPVPEHLAAPPPDAHKTPSGLASKVLSRGKGRDKPVARDQVKVRYTGWTTDGRIFDTSVAHGELKAFEVDQVIPGWSEGLQLMVVGEKRRLWIPEELAYRGAPGAPPGMLVFDLELVEIEKAPVLPETPKDVAAPPKNAEKTASGLASVVLKKGKGSKHPGKDAVVQVQYTGWTTDGKMFDSSITRGQPLSFRLDRVIPGWTEGVQLMVEGEKRRLWVPEALAYKGRPGAPQGMLVFDIELLAIKSPPQSSAQPGALGSNVHR